MLLILFINSRTDATHCQEHNISEEENRKITEMQDLDEVKITKGTKTQESVDKKERKKVSISVSPSF